MFRTGLDYYELRRDILLEKEAQRAETARLLREAGIVRQSRVSRLMCRVLSGTGRLLVSLGRTLQQRYEAPSLTLEKQAS
jgi:hypothetical protein